MIIASLFPCPFDVQVRHDFNAAIVTDDDIFAYEEAKLTAVKNDNTVSFAERSLMMGCRELGIVPTDVDCWVFPTPRRMPDADAFFTFFYFILKAYTGRVEDFGAWFTERVAFVDHHVAHVAHAALTSGFRDCFFVSMDGGGDLGDPRNFVCGEYRDGRFEFLDSYKGFTGPAVFHAFVTDALGYSTFDNGKVSGLAAYGTVQPDLRARLESTLDTEGPYTIFKRERSGRTGVDPSKTRPQEYRREKIFLQFPSETNVLRLCLDHLPHDIAATAEAIVSDVVVDFLRRLRGRTGMKQAVFSGGLWQNVALNRRVAESGLFESTFFPMASADSGLALGMALKRAHDLGRRDFPGPLTPFLGPSFDGPEVERLLIDANVPFVKDADVAATVARLIADGNVVGWFQGRAEYGPRSLGARSILADPRRIGSKSRINQILKRRDWFMPYAPAIPAERLSDWATTTQSSPYMQIAFVVHSDKAPVIPAAIHVDGSARIQAVERATNPRFWSLIETFGRITGVPVVLNTSFNRHGLPTISSPRQALEHLLEGNMDYLAIGDFLIALTDVRKIASHPRSEKPETVCLAENSIDRLTAVVRFGTPDQIAAYAERLGNLLGLYIAYTDGAFAVADRRGLDLTAAQTVLRDHAARGTRSMSA